MGRLGGRPRKIGVDRHPNGSVVRHVYDAGRRFCLSLFQSDEQRAKRDPREGSVAGRLVLKTTRNGGITQWEKHAGEKFAETVNAWRRKIASSPNPNAPAANLQGGTGKTPQADPFDLTVAEQDRIDATRIRFEEMRKLIIRENMERPPPEVLKRGQRVWDILEAIFICDQEVDEASVRFVRKYGLKPLELHFGLTGDDDPT